MTGATLEWPQVAMRRNLHFCSLAFCNIFSLQIVSRLDYLPQKMTRTFRRFHPRKNYGSNTQTSKNHDFQFSLQDQASKTLLMRGRSTGCEMQHSFPIRVQAAIL